jgi:hypothetical protein
MERWFIVLKTKEIIKKNLRLLLYVVFVLGLTIYLFIDTSGEAKGKAGNTSNLTAMPNEPTTESEATSESEVGEVEEQEVESFVEEDGRRDNRLSVVTGNPTEIDGHVQVSENESFELYLKEDNLSIIVRDKKTGAVMYSTVERPDKSNEKWSAFVKSGIVVEYLVGTNIVYSQADMSTKNLEKAIVKTSEGFTAHLNFKDLGISFDVKVQLNKNGLNISVPEESVREEGTQYQIGNLYLYPFLGYSKMDEEDGYLFLPDGSGALISLEDHRGQFRQPYSESVYGTNYGIDDPYVLSLKEGQVTTKEPNIITAPIFGVVHTNKAFGFLGVIEEGDYNAKIEAYPNGAILPYNWTTGKFIYRQFFNQSTSKNSGTMVVKQKKRNAFNATIQYNFVSGEEATYVGLAKSYREYLLKNDLINQDEAASEFRMKLDFLGADIKKGLLSNEIVAMTTFSEMDEILTSFQEEGLTSLEVTLKGWQENGIYGGYAQNKYAAEKALGGNRELNQLLAKYQNEIPIYLYDDALRFNSETQSSAWFNLVTKLNKRVLAENVYGNRFKEFNFLQPETSTELLEKRTASTAVTDYAGVTLGGITDHLFGYYAKGKEYGRKETLDVYNQLIEHISEDTSLMLDNSIQPYWQFATSLTNFPVTTSDYIFESEAIPFFSIALRGVVTRYAPYGNFVANKEEYKLQLIEQGIYPTYLITKNDPSELKNTNSSSVYSSKIGDYSDEILALYNELSMVQEEIGNGQIEDYMKEKEMVIVQFDNGKKLVLNYGETAEQIDGISLSAYSYKVVSK